MWDEIIAKLSSASALDLLKFLVVVIGIPGGVLGCIRLYRWSRGQSPDPVPQELLIETQKLAELHLKIVNENQSFLRIQERMKALPPRPEELSGPIEAIRHSAMMENPSKEGIIAAALDFAKAADSNVKFQSAIQKSLNDGLVEALSHTKLVIESIEKATQLSKKVLAQKGTTKSSG